MCFDFLAEIAYGKDELKLHKIQHYSHSRFFFFISLHSFILLPGICKFALDLFIEPSKRKITFQKTHNTKIKGEISQHKTQK